MEGSSQIGNIHSLLFLYRCLLVYPALHTGVFQDLKLINTCPSQSICRCVLWSKSIYTPVRLGLYIQVCSCSSCSKCRWFPSSKALNTPIYLVLYTAVFFSILFYIKECSYLSCSTYRFVPRSNALYTPVQLVLYTDVFCDHLLHRLWLGLK